MFRIATCTFLEGLCKITSISGVEKALRCQKAEHTFADTPCGIMDQFISSMGKDSHLLLIDCRSRSYQLVAVGDSDDIDPPIMLVTNSCIKHQLSGSEYPDRVKQCQTAVEVLRKKYSNIQALRDVTLEMLLEVKSELPSVVYNRAKHSVSEDIRTLATVDALSRKSYEEVGSYMVGSHNSLRDDYEVSCEELDALVEFAMQVPGVYGSRMTGGGFGGCTVTLVKSSCVENLKKHIITSYKEKFGLICECYEAKPSSGAGFFDLNGLL